MAEAKQSDLLPPKPWRFVCNRCNAGFERDVIPNRCDNCGNLEFRVERSDRGAGRVPLPGQMELFT